MRIVTTIAVIILFGSGTVFGFTDNGNSTITDSRTGLVWQQQDDATTRTWETAITYCEGLALAGQSDWRLPNIKELRTIVDNAKNSPAINTTYFPNTQSSNYWSSSTDALYTGLYAWTVTFYDGAVTAGDVRRPRIMSGAFGAGSRIFLDNTRTAGRKT
jgi:hypothetical protein